MGLDSAAPAPTTTIAPVPAHGHALTSPTSHPAPSTPLKANPSILNRLGRRLSQSKTQLVRRVSLGARTRAPSPTSHPQNSAPSTTAAAKPVSDTLVLVGPRADERDDRSPPTRPVATAQTTKGAGGLGLRRSLKALGRSRSEGTAPAVKRPREALDREIAGAQWRAAASWRAAVEYGGEAEGEGGTPPPQLLWEERLGLCWDGREQVLPDSPFYEPYSSNSDELPTRVVYASTLSTFPPRPPLVARPSLPPTPASLVIAEWRARYPLLSPSHSSPSLSDDFLSTAETSASATPIPTPRPRPPGQQRTGSVRSLASEVSSSEVPRFASASRSEDSNTSLESLRDDDKPVVRFALVDQGPVARPPPDPPAEQRKGRVKWTDFLSPEVDAREELESEGSDRESSEDWFECE